MDLDDPQPRDLSIHFVPSGVYEQKQLEKQRKRQGHQVDGVRVAGLYKAIISTPTPPVLRPLKKRKLPPVGSATSTGAAAFISQSEGHGEATFYFCEVCQMQVKNLGHEEHQHLTPHQIELARQLQPEGEDKKERPLVSYHLGRENVGFKMLQAGGWSAQEGLGKEGQGRREPVPTVLKNDKLGVGLKRKTRKEELEARKVTHTSEDIQKAAKSAAEAAGTAAPAAVIPQRMTAAQRERKESKERKWRQEMLRYMND